MTALTALAPAKVNLFLNVGPPGADGYHPLASLVAFADVGDRVTVRAADGLSLTVAGPFGPLIAEEPDNLILRALRALPGGGPALAVDLDKRLPIAAGLGGGSSDAGAALKLARDALSLPLDDDALARIAGGIGADGPMCLHARAAWAGGRGDDLTFEPRLPPLPAVLVNPGVPSLTGPVYRVYDATPGGQADCPPPPAAWDIPSVFAWLTALRNDLEAPAVALQPAIGRALAAVAALPGVRLARMSGSGATVFGLFDDPATAHAAAAALTRTHPDWWIEAAILS